MKRLLFLLAGVLFASTAKAWTPPVVESDQCLAAQCKCVYCHCVQKLEYACMEDEHNGNDVYFFLVRLCHDGLEICGVAPKPVVLNISQGNKDVSDEVLVSWKVEMDPNVPEGQVNYTITYKAAGVIKTQTGHFSYV
ncbi:MAG: hypothetical protein LIO68_07040 [Rikenellaceae bacterium]|nr:hypothetical protein [Rikenellaceae bacterium]